MTTQAPGLKTDTKQAVLRMVLSHKSAVSQVPNRVVRDAAATCGVSTRTVRRWIATQQVPTGCRTHWQPTQDQVNRMLTDFGSVRAYRLALIDEGIEVPSLSTMERGFREHTPTVHRVWAQSGYQAAKQLLPTVDMPDLAVNDEWSMDDALCPVWCRMPDGRVGKPWMQGLMDASSRRILTLTMSHEPFNSETAVETIAAGIQGFHTEDGVFIGGKPRSLRSDRGSIFVARATSLGLVAADIERRYSDAYEPQQNGKIERWHRSIKSTLKAIPGFDRTHYKKGDPRKAAKPPKAADVLLYEELCVEMQKAVRRYNNDRVHSAHGLTPTAEWTRQVNATPELVTLADDVAIRAAMRQSEKRTLRRRRIEWDTHNYAMHPHSVQEAETGKFDEEVVEHRARRIAAHEGRKVTIRFLHSRKEYLSVYTELGEYLGDAVREDLQTPEQAAETVRERRKHTKTMRDLLDDIATNGAAAMVLRREEALAFADPDYQPDDEAGDDAPVAGDPVASSVATPSEADLSSGRATGGNASHRSAPRPTTDPDLSTPKSRMEVHRQEAADRRRSQVEDAASGWVVDGETA
jgi:transposase InsO family protein